MIRLIKYRILLFLLCPISDNDKVKCCKCSDITSLSTLSYCELCYIKRK